MTTGTMNIVTATLASRAVSANQLKLTELLLADQAARDADDAFELALEEWMNVEYPDDPPLEDCIDDDCPCGSYHCDDMYHYSEHAQQLAYFAEWCDGGDGACPCGGSSCDGTCDTAADHRLQWLDHLEWCRYQSLSAAEQAAEDAEVVAAAAAYFASLYAEEGVGNDEIPF